MNIELKKVKYHDDMSQETPCFSAEIWQDHRFMAYVENSGHGGSNNLTPANGLTYSDIVHLDNLDVECTIFEMVYDEADRKKFQSKGFVLKKGNNSFTVKFPMNIKVLKRNQSYPTWLNKELETFKTDGYIVLNTNL